MLFSWQGAGVGLEHPALSPGEDQADWPDGRLAIRYRGVDLPYRTFDFSID